MSWNPALVAKTCEALRCWCARAWPPGCAASASSVRARLVTASRDSTTNTLRAEVRSPGIEQMLVDIMAAMTLAHAKEVFA